MNYGFERPASNQLQRLPTATFTINNQKKNSKNEPFNLSKQSSTFSFGTINEYINSKKTIPKEKLYPTNFEPNFTKKIPILKSHSLYKEDIENNWSHLKTTVDTNSLTELYDSEVLKRPAFEIIVNPDLNNSILLTPSAKNEILERFKNSNKPRSILSLKNHTESKLNKLRKKMKFEKMKQKNENAELDNFYEYYSDRVFPFCEDKDTNYMDQTHESPSFTSRSNITNSYNKNFDTKTNEFSYKDSNNKPIELNHTKNNLNSDEFYKKNHQTEIKKSQALGDIVSNLENIKNKIYNNIGHKYRAKFKVDL